MSRYDQDRSEIKGFIENQLRANLQAQGQGVSAGVDALIAAKADQMLDAFEGLAGEQLRRKHRLEEFWFGVGQSLVASLLFTVLIALLALSIYGIKQNPFRILVEEPPSNSPVPLPAGTP